MVGAGAATAASPDDPTTPGGVTAIWTAWCSPYASTPAPNSAKKTPGPTREMKIEMPPGSWSLPVPRSASGMLRNRRYPSQMARAPESAMTSRSRCRAPMPSS